MHIVGCRVYRMIVSMVILVKDLLCWFGVGGNVLCVGKLVRRVSECLGSGWWDAGMWIYGTKLNKIISCLWPR